MTALGPPGAAQAAEADAPTIAGLKWLGGRLERRARDARQAEADARRLSPDGYPHAERLAAVHAEAAAVYERAVADVLTELKRDAGRLGAEGCGTYSVSNAQAGHPHDASKRAKARAARKARRRSR